MSVKRMDRLPKRKITVDELLDRDALNDIINEIIENRSSIEDIIVIWTDGDNIHRRSNAEVGRVIGLLEATKFDVMHEYRHEED